MDGSAGMSIVASAGMSSVAEPGGDAFDAATCRRSNAAMNPQPALDVFDRRQVSMRDDLFAFLRFPTISTLPEHAGDLRACADWVRGQLNDAGLEAEVVSTGGHAAVVGDTGPAAGGPTLLFYGHYDVQPVGDASLWDSPAFEPTVRDGAVFARGAADDKGQVMTHLAAMRCWHEAGLAWPGRIKFLIEGEEEIGSPNLPEFVRVHRERLACDYIVISDTSKVDAATPALAVSTRGLVYKEIVVDGPSRDLHSGTYGGTVANPANALAKIIAALHDGQRRVAIPGFYDDVREFSIEERRSIHDKGLSDEELRRQTGSPAPAGESGYTSAERCGIRPTLDVNGLLSGFTGKGSSTIIPSRAMAKVSMRLVADQDPGKISRAFDAAVKEACPPGVTLTIHDRGSCAAYMAPSDSPGMIAARQALAASYGVEPVLAREGGTLPILPMFREVLKADSLMMGFAVPDCNLHSPNEFFHLSDFDTGTRCILRFLALCADIT